MTEKEHPDPRYINLEEYHPTTPWSKEAWEKASIYIMELLINPPDEPLPDEFYLLYNDEPKALGIDFRKGELKEADVTIKIVDDEPQHDFKHTGTTLHFNPEPDPHKRLEYLEKIQQALETKIENTTLHPDARTN